MSHDVETKMSQERFIDADEALGVICELLEPVRGPGQIILARVANSNNYVIAVSMRVSRFGNWFLRLLQATNFSLMRRWPNTFAMWRLTRLAARFPISLFLWFFRMLNEWNVPGAGRTINFFLKAKENLTPYQGDPWPHRYDFRNCVFNDDGDPFGKTTVPASFQDPLLESLHPSPKGEVIGFSFEHTFAVLESECLGVRYANAFRPPILPLQAGSRAHSLLVKERVITRF